MHSKRERGNEGGTPLLNFAGGVRPTKSSALQRRRGRDASAGIPAGVPPRMSRKVPDRKVLAAGMDTGGVLRAFVVGRR